ncbi:hypothetical protein RMSM_04622 [Rhodopirellula maiorica SM1]|uniref:Uncharacterized protein n=1 Tax=Rhodopirellula maiorica SM1 TaxID=1265738 RepID=M5RGL5_9BACT|nr:hypothetical protein RMSM_04622 [Rhodopirellula maiorica SM1]
MCFVFTHSRHFAQDTQLQPVRWGTSGGLGLLIKHWTARAVPLPK